MNLKLLQGYVLLTIALLILAAAAILLVTNLGDPWTLHVYWSDRTLPRAAWLLLAAGGGLVIWWTLRKVLPTGIAAGRQGAILYRTRKTEKQVKALERRGQ